MRVQPERAEGINNLAWGQRVWAFTLQTFDERGGKGLTYDVEMRGNGRQGTVNDGDWVEIPRNCPRAGEGLRPYRLRNLTTGDEVATRHMKALMPMPGDPPVRRRIKWAIIVVLVFALAGGGWTVWHKYGQPKNTALPPVGILPAAAPTHVRTTPSPSDAPVPAIHVSRRLDIPQTYEADLDEATVTEDGADIWFEARTYTDFYLTPKTEP